VIHGTSDMGSRVVALVENSANRCTPQEIRNYLKKEFSLSRPACHALLRTLVQEERLEYRYELGCTFLSLPLGRPLPVGNRMVIVPEGQSPGKAAHRRICICLRHGQAFGGGDHPTTRLAIEGMEWLQDNCPSLFSGKGSRQLDVGTGSGVLLIAGLHLGIGEGIGTDISENARCEARENCRLNGMQSRARILEKAPSDTMAEYRLITANLRFPTLISMQPWIADLVSCRGAVVLTGIRSHELPGLRRCYAGETLKPVWEAVRSDWACMVTAG
jgi:ribosomal protein L11 methyltransferase